MEIPSFGPPNAATQSHPIDRSMNTRKTYRGAPWLAGIVGGALLSTGGLHGAPFLYGPADLLLAFRQDGNSSDYVVNLGKATNYNAVASGVSLPIANLSTSQLNAAFPTLNGLKWSVTGANRPPEVPNYPLQTLWVTAPRLDPAVQSPPWLRKGKFVQGTGASQVDAVGVNAAASSSSQPSVPNNTATGVVIPLNTDFAFGPLIGEGGDFVGTFQGQVEAITADDFDGDPVNVSRADLYELIPGSSADGSLNAPGRYLGYFELKPNGSLTFNTGSVVIESPVISGIQRDGNTTTVSVKTVQGLRYSLRTTDASGLGSPITSWSKGSTLVGDGSVQSLQDASADASRFFVIEVQP